jgi:hypothetical protein
MTNGTDEYDAFMVAVNEKIRAFSTCLFGAPATYARAPRAEASGVQMPLIRPVRAPEPGDDDPGEPTAAEARGVRRPRRPRKGRG